MGSVKGAASKVEKAHDLVKTAETVAADRQLVVDAAAVPVRIAEATAALAVLDEANAAVHRPRDRATESLQRAHAALNTAQGLHQLPPGMTDQAQTVAAVTTLMRTSIYGAQEPQCTSGYMRIPSTAGRPHAASRQCNRRFLVFGDSVHFHKTDLPRLDLLARGQPQHSGQD